MIKEMRISPGGEVAFTFELTTPACPVRDRFKTQAEELVGTLPGVSEVQVKMTANVRPSFRQAATEMLPGVRQTIAGASGKGGVGKSTVAVNLASALQLSGAKVGLLDADIYGPSVPALTGTQEQPRVVEVPGADGKVERKLVPLEAYGLRLMSIGFLGGADQAMVWRGPMVSRAIQQMMSDVSWGDLDYLIIDLPPGTGDASLTVAQSVPLSGVAIVATPQDLALDIAVKALQMFRSLNVTPLGLIENMSWYVCPSCGNEHHLFGHGGAERAAPRLRVPLPRAIPLHPGIPGGGDRGAPPVSPRPGSGGAQGLSHPPPPGAPKTSIHAF